MNRFERQQVSQAAGYFILLKKAFSTKDYSEITEDRWDQITHTINELSKIDHKFAQMSYASLVIMAEGYCRLHGLHEKYLTWSKQINLLATAQTLSDKDIEEYLEITKSQNSDRSEALNVFALYEMQMGMSLIPLGNFQMAEIHFKSALARIGSNENREKGLILLNYGVLKRNMGKYKESQKLFNRVLKIAIDLNDLDLQGVATGNIGESYRKTNNFDQAINYLEQSVVLADEVGDRSGKGVRLGNLASAYVQTYRTEDAIKNYELAREIAIELNDQMGLAKRTANLGRARYMGGEREIGEELIREGLKTKKELGNKLGIAEDTFWLGTIEHDKKNPQEARRYFQMAISNYEAVGQFEDANRIRELMSQTISSQTTTVKLDSSFTKSYNLQFQEAILSEAMNNDEVFILLDKVLRGNPINNVPKLHRQGITFQDFDNSLQKLSKLLSTKFPQADISQITAWVELNADNLLKNIQRRTLKKFDFFQWLRVSFVAFILAGTFNIYWGSFSLGFFGFILGFIQLYAVNKFLRAGWIWTLFTLIPYLIIGYFSADSLIPSVSLGVLMGIAMGMFQSLIFPMVLKRAWIWIIGNGLGMGIALIIASIYISNTSRIWVNLVFGLGLGGILFGLVTGYTLNFLIRLSTDGKVVPNT